MRHRVWLYRIIGMALLLLSVAPLLAAPLPQEATPTLTPTAFVPPTVQQPPTATPRPTATAQPGVSATPTPRARVALPTPEMVRSAALRGALIALAFYGVGLLYLLIRAGIRVLLRLRHHRRNRFK